MTGRDGLRAARRSSVMILLSVSIYFMLTISVRAEARNFVDDKIGDFDKDTFLIKYGEEKVFSVKNTIETSVKPMDVILLVDVSISMNNYPGTEETTGKYRIDLEKRIATRIISEAPSYSRIAIIQFGEENKPTEDFTYDKSRLQEIIKNLEATGSHSRAGEKLDEAITLAIQNENPCIIVLITDGIEAGEGLYIFSDFIGKAKVEEIPIICALINSDIEYGEFKKEINETHGFLTVIKGEPDIIVFTAKTEDFVGEYCLEEFTIQIIPSSEVNETFITIVQGNSLFPRISGTKVMIASFSPGTKLKLAVESTIDVTKYDEPLQITPYSLVVTYTNPILEKKVTIPEKKTSQVYVEFEPFFDHYKEMIMLSILGIGGVIGLVILGGYNRRQKRIMAQNLVNSAERDIKNHEYGKAIGELEKAIEFYTQLRDPESEELKTKVDSLRRERDEIEKKRSRIIRILSETQGNLEKIIEILRTEHYIEEFFPNFARLRNTLDVKNITKSALTASMELIRSNNDPEVIERYFHNLEKFSKESASQFLSFSRAQNIYQNDNSRELMALLLEQHSCIGIDYLEKVFFEDGEVARYLLNLWRLEHPEKVGEFNDRICSEEKEGYEFLTKLKSIYEDISQRMEILRKEISCTFLEALRKICVDVDETLELSQKVLQEFSSKYEETCDPEYESVILTCRKIQEDLICMKNAAETLENQIKGEIELKIGSLRDKFDELKRRIELGDYQNGVLDSLYKLQSSLQSVGMIDMLNECSKVTADLDRKMSIVELLNNTRAMSIDKLCENLGIFPDDHGKEIVRNLCRQIIIERKPRSDIPQYQLFTDSKPEIFLDFNLLAKYTMEIGKAPSEIETDLETLHLPRRVHTDLINVLKRSGVHD